MSNRIHHEVYIWTLWPSCNMQKKITFCLLMTAAYELMPNPSWWQGREFEPWPPRSGIAAEFTELGWTRPRRAVLKAIYMSIMNATTRMNRVALLNPPFCTDWLWQNVVRRRNMPSWWNSCWKNYGMPYSNSVSVIKKLFENLRMNLIRFK